MDLSKRKQAFIKLGEFLNDFISKKETGISSCEKNLQEAISTSFHINGWFTSENIMAALSSIAFNLESGRINSWLSNYGGKIDSFNNKKVGVIMAGNIPFVGFHDFLCVLISGNKFYGKLSSNDPLLLPALAEILISIEPGFKEQVIFSPMLKKLDAVIATGSNNTSRYFDYYFGKYPHIIRKNRNSAAIITGEETKEELVALGKDIFQYFGLGCRSVSKLFVPQNYQFDQLFEAIYQYKWVIDNNKYANNYQYYRTIHLMNNEKLLDNGFVILKEDAGLTSPPGVIYYEKYDQLQALEDRLMDEAPKIQCLLGKGRIPFSKSQQPDLWDYADNVDTIRFLLN